MKKLYVSKTAPTGSVKWRDYRPMKIKALYWDNQTNQYFYNLECSCGQVFQSRADRWWLSCPSHKCNKRVHQSFLIPPD